MQAPRDGHAVPQRLTIADVVQDARVGAAGDDGGIGGRLGAAAAAQQFRPRIEVVAQKTGTDNAMIVETINYGELEVPAVMRSGRRHAQVEAMAASGVDKLDIPAFLRKQAD